MNHRVVVLAIAGALWVGVSPLRAEDPTTSRVERPARTQTRPEDNGQKQKDPDHVDSKRTDPEDTNWTFDRSLYTNSPTTGARVWQYAKKKPAYRDPYSFFDSPHEAYPFAPDPFYGPNYFAPYPYYGGYPYSRPYPYGPMPYVPSAQ